MDNRKINQDVYDRYVDATVALFMEYYSAERAEDMHNELAGNEKIEVELPAELDNRCRTLIKKEHARRKRKQHLKSATKGLRFVASFAVTIFALASVLFISVDAIRVPIINYYIKQNDSYWEFSSRNEDGTDDWDWINTEDPLAGLIPDEYELVTVDNRLPIGLSAIYADANSNEILFSTCASTSILRLDTEEAQIAKERQIGKDNGILVVKDGQVTLAWGNEQYAKTFVLVADELTEQEIVSIAEQFIQGLNSSTVAFLLFDCHIYCAN